MLTRRGASIPVGDPNVRTGRAPASLAVGDHDGDGLPDLLILEAGPAPGSWLRGVADNSVVGGVRFNGQRFAHPRSIDRVVTMRSSSARDVAVLIDTAGGNLFAFALDAAGTPQASQLDAAVAQATVPTSLPTESALVGDLDGDGADDVAAVASFEDPAAPGQVALELSVWWGGPAANPGDPLFESKTLETAQLPGHAIADGPRIIDVSRIGANGRSLALTVVDRTTRPNDASVHLLASTTTRSWAAASDPGTVSAAGIADTSIGADVDGDGVFEMLQGHSAACSSQTVLWTVDNSTSSLLQHQGTMGVGEQTVQIDEFHMLSPATSGSRSVIYARHRAELETAMHEDRLTAVFIEPSQSSGAPPSLRDPFVRRNRPSPVRSIAVGMFEASATAQQAAILHDDAIVLVPHDDVGEANVGNSTQIDLTGTGFQPAPGTDLTKARIAARPGRDLLIQLLEDGRVLVVDAELGSAAGGLTTSPDLRTVIDPALAGATVDPRSTVITGGDVDGDGHQDMVVLMVLSNGTARALVLLRGRPDIGAATEFPFSVTPVSGDARLPEGVPSGMAFGDLAPERLADPTSTAKDELAVAIPLAGTIRFFAFDTDTSSLVLAESDRQGNLLPPGSGPRSLTTADMDGDAIDDLLVASSGDSQLRVLLNFVDPNTVTPGRVRVSGFFIGGEGALPAGTANEILLSDQDGDGTLDAVVLVTPPTPGTAALLIQCLISDGDGAFLRSWQVPPGRTASRPCGAAIPPPAGRASADLIDLNNDGIGDLVIGWEGAPGIEPHIRVLFGSHR